MPATRHIETHFTATATVRDIVIGMSDGLTVPFALAAGLAGTISSPNVIVVAGFAEIAAGAIAMGLGGYLAARTSNAISKKACSPTRSHDTTSHALRSGACDEIPALRPQASATELDSHG